MGPMANPFYHDLGLSKDAVGAVRASIGLVATLARHRRRRLQRAALRLRPDADRGRRPEDSGDRQLRDARLHRARPPGVRRRHVRRQFRHRLRRRRAGDLHVEPDEHRLYGDAVRAAELRVHLRRQVREGVLGRDGRAAGGRAPAARRLRRSSSSAPACSACRRSILCIVLARADACNAPDAAAARDADGLRAHARLVPAVRRRRRAPAAPSLFDPALRFRTLPTEHFVIYFHQGEERLAQRLAAIAEETWRALERPLGVTPPRLTHVVLADQTELANGYATPLPYDTIVIYTVCAVRIEFDFDDWLRLVFTHEFTHIVHLDRSEGWARVVRIDLRPRRRSRFRTCSCRPGRSKGSRPTRRARSPAKAGCTPATSAPSSARRRAQHRLEPLDRVNGGLTDWPGGAARVRLRRRLSSIPRRSVRRRHARGAGRGDGAPRCRTSASPRVQAGLRRVARRPVARLRGEPVAAASQPPSPMPALTRLTHQGFSVSGPRFDRFACAGCPPEIVYSAVNPRRLSRRSTASALDGGEPRQLTTRYLGSTTAIGRDAIYFDQLEVRRNVGALQRPLRAVARRRPRAAADVGRAAARSGSVAGRQRRSSCVQNRPGSGISCSSG